MRGIQEAISFTKEKSISQRASREGDVAHSFKFGKRTHKQRKIGDRRLGSLGIHPEEWNKLP
jgi:hypothetical protein